MAICVICEDEEATSKCTTCQKCRAYIHRWGNERDARIIGHFDALRIRVRRMTTFAFIEDERVKHVDEKELVQKKIIYRSRKNIRRAKSNVVSLRVAVAERRRAMA